MLDHDIVANLDELSGAKWGSATAMVPPAVAHAVRREDAPPEVGDVAVAEVVRTGEHRRIEGPQGQRQTLYPGDRVVGVFGHRYAPDQFEGYAGTDGDTVHLLSGAAVLGIVRSRHADVSSPTRSRLLGYLTGSEGQRLNTRQFGIRPSRLAESSRRPMTVAVVGTMMNAGKTTAAAAMVRGAVRRGLVVGAAKVTGTASGKDVFLMRDAGARRALDFTVCGWPSTYLCSASELEETFLALYGGLLRGEPEVVVLELADGITQRETAMLLRSPVFTAHLDAVVFAAGDALGAEGGVSRLRALGLPVVATSGRASMSPLLIAETVSLTRLPCLSREALEAGAALDLITRTAPTPHAG